MRSVARAVEASSQLPGTVRREEPELPVGILRISESKAGRPQTSPEIARNSDLIEVFFIKHQQVWFVTVSFGQPKFSADDAPATATSTRAFAGNGLDQAERIQGQRQFNGPDSDFDNLPCRDALCFSMTHAQGMSGQISGQDI